MLVYRRLLDFSFNQNLCPRKSILASLLQHLKMIVIKSFQNLNNTVKLDYNELGYNEQIFKQNWSY